MAKNIKLFLISTIIAIAFCCCAKDKLKYGEYVLFVNGEKQPHYLLINEESLRFTNNEQSYSYKIQGNIISIERGGSYIEEFRISTPEIIKTISDPRRVYKLRHSSTNG